MAFVMPESDWQSQSLTVIMGAVWFVRDRNSVLACNARRHSRPPTISTLHLKVSWLCKRSGHSHFSRAEKLSVADQTVRPAAVAVTRPYVGKTIALANSGATAWSWSLRQRFAYGENKSAVCWPPKFPQPGGPPSSNFAPQIYGCAENRQGG